jgi:hypothetical protein
MIVNVRAYLIFCLFVSFTNLPRWSVRRVTAAPIDRKSGALLLGLRRVLDREPAAPASLPLDWAATTGIRVGFVPRETATKT